MLILRKQDGFSLTELMIGIAIIALLSTMAAPSFSLWIQSTQNRTAAESILNGMQLARTEAVRQNTNVFFCLTDASGRVTWTVASGVAAGCETSTSAILHQRSGTEAGGNARIGVAVATGSLATPLSAGTGLPAGVTFDSLGRAPAANGTTDIARVDVINAVRSDARRMVILVGAGGQTRMCDPGVVLAHNPQGCQ